MSRKLLHKIATRFRRSSHEPIISVLIHKAAYLNNLKLLQNLTPAWQLAPVIKSNAYGHGLVQIAEILDEQKDFPFICVDSLAEASILRHVGVRKALLILGHTPTDTIKKNKIKNIAFTVGSLEEVKGITSTPATIHLKFDTGMHRQGIAPELYPEVSRIIKESKLRVEGVLSHLADAETADSPLTQSQIEVWNNLAHKFQKDFPDIKYYHLANSAGLAHYDKINANLARPGIATYGLNPGNLPINLQPVLEMRAVISEIRDLKPGESVGYNATFTADRPMRIATIPCGYYEGIDRRLSNKGCYRINGEFAPIVGRVSMNITSCDITNIPEATIGAPVTIISNIPEDPNSAESIAKAIGTIFYEVLTGIPNTLRREVFA